MQQHFAVQAISGFRSEVVETFGLLGCYAAHVGNWLPKFWYNISASLIFKGQAVQKEYSSRDICGAYSFLKVDTLFSWRKILKLNGNIEMSYDDVCGS